jgi:hypothetical protein
MGSGIRPKGSISYAEKRYTGNPPKLTALKPSAHKTRQYLSLTYQPKIPGVIAGDINQTIRREFDIRVGDYIGFHGWSGTPYRSPWSFRTPLSMVLLVDPIKVYSDRIDWGDEVVRKLGDPTLDDVAAHDGIEPATGEALLSVLGQMHELYDHIPIEMQIITWNSWPMKCQRPYCYAFPHLQKDENGLVCGINCDHFVACQEAFGLIAHRKKDCRDNPALSA